jgi:hypothetical protein
MWVDPSVFQRLHLLLRATAVRPSEFMTAAIDAYESGKFIVPVPARHP